MKRQVIMIIVVCFTLGGVAGWWIRGGEEHPGHEHTHEAADGTVYTCSMHPQIRQNEPGKCPLCGMALTLVGDGKKAGGNRYVLEMTPEAVALSNVSTTRVKSGDTSPRLRLSGKIQADERRVQSITANFSGRVDQLHVNFTGQEVVKGQKLATMYSPELVNAQKELLETSGMRGSHPSLYEAARQKLRLWKITDEQIAAVESNGEVMTQVDIFAEASGVVTARNVAVGDYVQRGSVLFEATDLSRVWVVMDAYESDLAYVRNGDEVKFHVSSYPGRDFAGKVTYIDPVLNPDTRTVSVRAEAANPGHQLKPGMFVASQIEGVASAKRSGLLIPRTAILWTGPRAVVYVHTGSKDAPAFEMREVRLGSRVGDEYEVLAGVDEDDHVVSNGVFAVDAAAQLTGNYSMMTRPEDNSLDVPEEFRKQLAGFAKAYLLIKDALVDTNAERARSQAQIAQNALANVDVSLLDEKANNGWMKVLEPIRDSLGKIRAQTDVEEQRKHFESLSDSFIEAVGQFGLSGMSLYRQYCPMAFNDKGAYWLSAEEEVRNPYFGDRMMSCGEVKETYR